MNHDSNQNGWPPEAGDPHALPIEVQPPAELEDRIVGALKSRALIGTKSGARPPAWRVLRASFAAAACVALIALGAWIGRVTGDFPAPPGAALTGAETDLYALLLYETDGYDAPGSTEALTRYGEYSRWVAEARRREQFVTGQDLEVDRGWLVVPQAGGATVEPATAVAAKAPLSGIFFIRARDPEHALELARGLPHVKHGGRVLVQKTIPTASPPAKSD